MKKVIKSFLVMFVMCVCLVTSMIPVYAQSVYETEPNDTMETAQLIQANRETAAQTVNGSRPNQYVAKGYASTSDADWYKVYLTTGIQYVTCNGESYDFEVYNPNFELIMSNTYVKTGFGVRAYSFTASIEGYYYVKVSGVTSISEDYILLVGDPTYSIAKCEVNFGRVTMASRQDQSLVFNLRFEDQLPNNAVVYMMSMQGLRSSSVSSIRVNNHNKSVNLNTFTWDKSGLVLMNLPLRTDWSIDLRYNKNTSFTPSIELYYVYPVTSEQVENSVFFAN